MKSPLELLMAILDDIQRLHCGEKGINRDKNTIESRFEHEGYSFLTVTLPRFCESLEEGLSNSKITCPLGFKKLNRGVLPRFLSGLLCDVFDPSTGYLLTEPSVEAILSLRQICRMFKKLVLSNDQDVCLDRKVKNEFRQTDSSLSDHSFDSRRIHLLSRVSGYTLLDLGLPDLEKIPFQHGPGAVFEGASTNQKWKVVVEGLFNKSFESSDYGLDCFGALERAPSTVETSRTMGRTSWRMPVRTTIERSHSIFSSNLSYESRAAQAAKHLSLERSLLAQKRVPQNTPQELIWISNGKSEKQCSFRMGSIGRISRLVSVPKSSTSKRSITVEPTVAQFLQQGLNLRLRKAILRDPYLRNCLDLSDQGKSQQLALEGSLTGAWDTLDLKSASDLLSKQLVTLCFASKPIFLSALMSTRSLIVKVDDDLVSLNKYAGMGNATTFPVQSVCYALICIAAIMDCEGWKPTRKRVMHATNCIRVYGDDIIVKREYTRHVIDWIEAFGLKVNPKKSFFSGRFRESCGIDAYAGVNVTPLYIRFDPTNITRRDPSQLASLTAYSNSLFEKGYYKAADLVKETVEKSLGRLLPLVARESGGLGWHTRQNTSHLHRWNKYLHRFETRTFVVRSKKFDDVLDGYPALLKSFMIPLIARSEDHLKRTTKKFRSRLVMSYVNATQLTF